jgi:hypothetical protein
MILILKAKVIQKTSRDSITTKNVTLGFKIINIPLLCQSIIIEYKKKENF